MTSADPVQLHRTSIAVASTYVTRITDADLARSTPCSQWNLRQLLEHMVGQHAGFAEVHEYYRIFQCSESAISKQ